jgi:MFS superfamily sulfate permease-like transporter
MSATSTVDDTSALSQDSSSGLRQRKWIEKVPGYGAAKETAQFLDKRLPKIRGRPMITEFARNIKSGVTVSLVSLPLSVSLALAADATPVQGLLTAIYAGLVSGLFGG